MQSPRRPDNRDHHPAPRTRAKHNHPRNVTPLLRPTRKNLDIIPSIGHIPLPYCPKRVHFSPCRRFTRPSIRTVPTPLCYPWAQRFPRKLPVPSSAPSGTRTASSRTKPVSAPPPASPCWRLFIPEINWKPCWQPRVSRRTARSWTASAAPPIPICRHCWRSNFAPARCRSTGCSAPTCTSWSTCNPVLCRRVLGSLRQRRRPRAMTAIRLILRRPVEALGRAARRQDLVGNAGEPDRSTPIARCRPAGGAIAAPRGYPGTPGRHRNPSGRDAWQPHRLCAKSPDRAVCSAA